VKYFASYFFLCLAAASNVGQEFTGFVFPSYFSFWFASRRLRLGFEQITDQFEFRIDASLWAMR